MSPDPLLQAAHDRRSARLAGKHPVYTVRADDVSALVADGHTIRSAAELLAISETHCRALWRVVCAETGETVRG